MSGPGVTATGLVLGVVSVQLPAIFPSTGGRSRPSWSRAA